MSAALAHIAALQLILNIAEGSATANSLPNLGSYLPSERPANGHWKGLISCSGCSGVACEARGGDSDELDVHPRLGRGGGIGVGATPMCSNVAATRSSKSASGLRCCIAVSAYFRQQAQRHCNHSAIRRASKLCGCGFSRQLTNLCRPSLSSIIVKAGSVVFQGAFKLPSPQIPVRMITNWLNWSGHPAVVHKGTRISPRSALFRRLCARRITLAESPEYGVDTLPRIAKIAAAALGGEPLDPVYRPAEPGAQAARAPATEVHAS